LRESVIFDRSQLRFLIIRRRHKREDFRRASAGAPRRRSARLKLSRQADFSERAECVLRKTFV